MSQSARGQDTIADARIVTVAILSVSSAPSLDDPTGELLRGRCEALGHEVLKRLALGPAREAIETQLRAWVAEESIDVILVAGGAGPAAGDVTPDAVRAVLERELPGYGESVRRAHEAQVGLRAIAGRETGGVCGGTFIFAVGGELETCARAWDAVLGPLLDPSSEASLIPFLPELVAT